jgi:iron-sulfur cluster assembly protein
MVTDTIPALESETALDEAPPLSMTRPAADKLQKLLVEKNIPDYGLRVFVAGGGCSGLQYGMAFEKEASEFDAVIEAHGVRLYLDPTSAQYLMGASIEYVDNLMGGGFRIDNPNAVASCGCGQSFRTQDSASTGASGGGHGCN